MKILAFILMELTCYKMSSDLDLNRDQVSLTKNNNMTMASAEQDQTAYQYMCRLILLCNLCKINTCLKTATRVCL